MNDDDHGTVVPASDYRYAQNVHIMYSADGGVAAIKNVPGTTEVSFVLGGTSGQKVVGSIEDEEHNRVFYFIKTTLGNHEILCYDRTSNVIRRVLSDNILTSVDGQPDSLAFSTDYLITGVAFIYPWLFWTDNNNAPRRIDVERGMRTYDPTYLSPDLTVPVSYTVPINYKDLAVAHEVPTYPIEVRKLLSTDEADVPDQTTNQIALYAFQFSYRFIFRDGTISVLSPYSKVVNYNSDEDPDEFDTIEVKIPKAQRIPNEVTEIQLLSRDPQTNNWGIIKRYLRSIDSADFVDHNTLGGDALTHYFFNTYASTLIQESEGLKLFDSIPLKSQAMEVAQNRLFLANNLEGYDPIAALILSADQVVNNTSAPAGSTTYIYVYPDTDSFDPDHFAALVVRINSGDPAIDGYYYVSDLLTYDDFQNGNLPTELFINPLSKLGDLGDFDPFDTGLIQLFSDTWGVSPPNGPGPGPNAFVDNTYTGTQPTVYGLGGPGDLSEGDLIFKSGSRYQIGIVFFDYAGRNAGVYTNDNCIIDIPERGYTATDYTTGLSWLIDGVVNNNNIPYWATHYAIVRTKNLTTDFFFVSGFSNRAYVTRDDDGLLVYSYGAYPTTADLYAIGWELYADRDGYGYTFAQGDVLKYFPDDNSAPKFFSIIGQDGRFVLTTPSNEGDFTAAGGGKIEIYTPLRSSDTPIFYEVGEVYDIEDAGTVSKAFSVYAGVLRGDTTLVTTNDNTLSPYLVEAMSPNIGLWQVWNTDAGRPNVILYDSRQSRRETAIRWSNQYVAGAKINGLCTFDEVDEVVLDESCGPIQKLVLAGKAQSEGSVMLSIGANNTFSMYLGETQIVDNSDQTLLATSGRIIGTTRDLRGGYGTNHPESVVENDGRVYWYDEQRGAVVRYAANGLTPISDYKFRAFFNRLSGQTRNQPVIGGFDRLRTEYLLCAKALSTDDDVEWLNDYQGDFLFRDRLLTTDSLVSTGSTLYAGATYTFTVSWPAGGVMTLYVGDVEVDAHSFVMDEEYDFVITPSQTGILSYYFNSKGSPSRGNGTLTGPRISPHQAWQGEDFTIGFRDVDGVEGFTSFYSFTPEWFSKSGNLLLSFRNGKLYRHDNELAYNTFYSTQYNSGIAWVVNNPVPVIKWAAAIGVQSNYAPSWVHIRTEIPYVQSSDLEDEDMVLREGFYYADVLRDRLSPNATGSYYDRSLRGDKMRSSLLEVYVEFSTFADELYVYLVKTMWQPSSGHF